MCLDLRFSLSSFWVLPRRVGYSPETCLVVPVRTHDRVTREYRVPTLTGEVVDDQGPLLDVTISGPTSGHLGREPSVTVLDFVH